MRRSSYAESVVPDQPYIVPDAQSDLELHYPHVTTTKTQQAQSYWNNALG